MAVSRILTQSELRGTVLWVQTPDCPLCCCLPSGSLPVSGRSELSLFPQARCTDQFVFSWMGKTVVALNIFFFIFRCISCQRKKDDTQYPCILLRGLQHQVETETRVSFSHVPRLHVNQSTSNDADLPTLSAELMLLAASYEPLCLSSCLLISKHPLSEDAGHPAISVN